MDSYIQKRRERIKTLQLTVIIKYSLCVFLLMSLPIWIFSMFAQPNPETWQRADVVCSDVSMQEGKNSTYGVLETEDGNYVFDSKLISYEQLDEAVEKGDECSLVYVAGAEDVRLGKALSVNGGVIVDEDVAAEQWAQSRRSGYITIAAVVVAALIALLLIDKVWCKAEKQEIKQLKAEIEKRESKKAERKG